MDCINYIYPKIDSFINKQKNFKINDFNLGRSLGSGKFG